MLVSREFEEFRRRHGRYLIDVGTNSYALSKPDALKAIEMLRGGIGVLLGGDVLELVDGRLRYRVESWYYQPIKKSVAVNVTNSVEKGLTYINRFPDPENGSIYYDLCVEGAFESWD